MFNGIVEETGIIEAVEERKNLAVLRVRARKVLEGTRTGDSIAVNGVCLTVTDKMKNVLAFDLMRETLQKTSLEQMERGDKVNLERALAVGDRINGHFVTGHVDVVSKIRDVLSLPNYLELVVGLPRPLARYVTPKGSVCLDGVSLTVGRVQKNFFTVYLIPFTRQHTTLGLKKKGDAVNIETDILAKYVRSKAGVQP